MLAGACGPGPTERPRTPDRKIAVSGIFGSFAGAPEAAEPGAEPSSSPKAASSKVPAKARTDVFQEGLGDGSEKTSESSSGPQAAEARESSTPAMMHDPFAGGFSVAQATEGLESKGSLVASLRTSKGEIRCRLFDDKAPVAVANFVGLARGVRPFREKGKWVTRKAYDGTIFHRVIKGFMIQGGDPQGTGRGEPGYVFPDELWRGPGSKHDRAGLLCMANRGPDTNGMQFFITDAAAPHLDASYTIFGECSPVTVVHAIARVATDGSDRPLDDVVLESVEITRREGVLKGP